MYFNKRDDLGLLTVEQVKVHNKKSTGRSMKVHKVEGKQTLGNPTGDANTTQQNMTQHN